MTDLNLSLWGAGVALILIVIAYNFWQEYKAKKNVQRAFGEHKDDVLMTAEIKTTSERAFKGNERQEPSLGIHSIHSPSEEVSSGQSVGAAPAGSLHNESFSVDAPIDLPVDDFIDCVIPMDLENPARGDKILSEIQSIRIVGNKPVNFIGVNADGHREAILHGNSYTQIICGVRLVNRSGALNELEYSELVMKLRQISDNLNAFLDVPDMKHVVDAGRDLSLFVNEHDAQLSVNVLTKGAPWEINTLLAALEKQGFAARPDGRLAMPDGEGGVLFTLSINGSLADQVTSRVTLLLDVPCVAPKRGGFNAMVSCAKSLALRLGGLLVDDSNTLLDEATLNQIQDQVDAFYNTMQAADIPAGSTRAMRIFS